MKKIKCPFCKSVDEYNYTYSGYDNCTECGEHIIVGENAGLDLDYFRWIVSHSKNYEWDDFYGVDYLVLKTPDMGWINFNELSEVEIRWIDNDRYPMWYSLLLSRACEYHGVYVKCDGSWKYKHYKKGKEVTPDKARIKALEYIYRTNKEWGNI